MNETLVTYLKTGGLGFITGFVIGYAFKKFSKFLVIIIGLFLIGFQLLVYNAIININWNWIESVSKDILSNQDSSLEKVKQILLVNLPFAGAAGLGFLLGIKKG
jgi:uncharacterized membrane protein (Fun14 family)